MTALVRLDWGRRRSQLPPRVAWRKCVNRLGTWNVRGINRIGMREEVVNVFKKGKFEFTCTDWNKLKGVGCFVEW